MMKNTFLISLINDFYDDFMENKIIDKKFFEEYGYIMDIYNNLNKNNVGQEVVDRINEIKPIIDKMLKMKAFW